MKGRIMKKIFGILSALCFLYLVGVAGALDNDVICSGEALTRAIIGSALFVLFAVLSGAMKVKEGTK